MMDYRKIDALSKDVSRSGRLATFLSKLPEMSWTDWEADFLEAMASRTEALSTRQAEKLVELEEAAIWHEKTADGFSVRRLVASCFLARADLESDEDVAFIERLHHEGCTRLRRRGLQRLLRCARALGVIEPHAGRALEPRMPQEA